MTNYCEILRQLIIAGYEGESLLAAFERMCAAIGGVRDGVVASASKHAMPRHAKPKVTLSASRAPVAYPPPDGAKAIGRKALAASGLSSSAIRVGSQLLEHYNVKSGRCDPGISGLAGKASISARSVQRAIADLVTAGLFTVGRNAGQGHRNAYFPAWPRIVELADGVVAGVTVSSSGGDKSVAQNQRTKPDSDSLPVKAPRGRKPDHVPGQRSMLLPMAGGRAVRAPQQAQAGVEATRSKLNQQLNNHLQPHGKSVFVDGLTRSMDVDWSPAIAAEMRRAGEGLPVLLAAIEAAKPRRAVG